jgi:formylglycine-generating enzyme required for sulfatase activity
MGVRGSRGSATPFWWGESDGEAPAQAWFKQNSAGHTHPVGSKPPNAFGLYDMAGNVWQWTEDYYDNATPVLLQLDARTTAKANASA